MDYKDVPREEIETGRYSPETIEALLDRARREHRESARKSAAKYVPLFFGTYLSICACFAGYALAYDESIWFFSRIYLAMIWLWIPVGAIVSVQSLLHRPTESTIKEELSWYAELLECAKDNGKPQH